MKSGIYILISKILKHCHCPQAESGNSEETEFSHFLLQCIGITISSLSICANETDPRILIMKEDPDAQTFFYKQLKFLTDLHEQSSCQRMLSQYTSAIFLKIILPMSISLESEKSKIQTDPWEFVSFSLDMIGKQASKVPKMQAIYLWELLGDHMDGFVSYGVNMLIQSFELLVSISMTSNSSLITDPKLITEMFPKTRDIIDTAFWNNYNSEQKLDSILVLLADAAYWWEQRRDILMAFEFRLSTVLSGLLATTSPIISCRLLMLFGQYKSYLFLEPSYSENFKSVIQFIINSVLVWSDADMGGGHSGQNEYLTIKLQAIETLSSFLNKEDLWEKGHLYIKLKPYMGDVLSVLSKSFHTNSDVKLVSTIRDIFRCFGFVIVNSDQSALTDLLAKTAGKASREIQNCANSINFVSKTTAFEC